MSAFSSPFRSLVRQLRESAPYSGGHWAVRNELASGSARALAESAKGIKKIAPPLPPEWEELGRGSSMHTILLVNAFISTAKNK